VISAAQSILGRILIMSFGFSSISSCTSSASFGWRGKQALEDLQALTAQVRKLRVSTFIIIVVEESLYCIGRLVVEWKNTEGSNGELFFSGRNSSVRVSYR
jgi:hypothetical protein